jgi:hypothetical protein
MVLETVSDWGLVFIAETYCGFCEVGSEFLANFPHLKIMAYEITMLSLCLYIPFIDFWMLETIFMKDGMCVMAPEPI